MSGWNSQLCCCRKNESDQKFSDEVAADFLKKTVINHQGLQYDTLAAEISSISTLGPGVKLYFKMSKLSIWFM